MSGLHLTSVKELHARESLRREEAVESLAVIIVDLSVQEDPVKENYEYPR